MLRGVTTKMLLNPGLGCHKRSQIFSQNKRLRAIQPLPTDTRKPNARDLHATSKNYDSSHVHTKHYAFVWSSWNGLFHPQHILTRLGLVKQSILCGSHSWGNQWSRRPLWTRQDISFALREQEIPTHHWDESRVIPICSISREKVEHHLQDCQQHPQEWRPISQTQWRDKSMGRCWQQLC